MFDAVGKSSFRRCRRLLKPGGIYASTDLGHVWHNPPLTLLTRHGRRSVMVPIPKYRKEHVLYFIELVEAGAFRPVIDRKLRARRSRRGDVVLETEQKVGNVVITLATILGAVASPSP